MKESVERALHFAQEYRDACAKAAAFGSDEYEIGAIKCEIQNCGSLDRLMTFVETMTTLFANCKTRLETFMNANESAKILIHDSLKKMEEQQRLAQEQKDESIKVAVVGGAVAIGGLFLTAVTGPVGGLAVAVGSLIAAGGTASACMKASLLEAYSRGLQEITGLNRDLCRARTNVDALQQKMSECHNCLCRVGQHRALKRQDVIMTITTKKSICHSLNCMCRYFGEVQTLAAM